MFDRAQVLTRGDFLTIGNEFKRAAEALEEQAPKERDEEDSSYSPSEDKDVDVSELFRDL